MFGRFDGVRASGVPSYRRIMPFLMRGRNEAAVYFEQTLDMTRALPWLAAFSAERSRELHATPFHLVLAALARVLHRHPRLNRFVSGRRLYERRGVFFSFAAKQRMDDDAPLRVIKREMPVDERFEQLVRALAGEVEIARGEALTPLDKEVGALLKLPGRSCARRSRCSAGSTARTSRPGRCWRATRCTRARFSPTWAASRSTPPTTTCTSTAPARCSSRSAP
jgi:hypothetical protein